MSLLNGYSALGAASAIGGALTNALFLKKRSIAGFVPDVIVEERHEDRLSITEHPVESGANITDHAYKEPAELVMTVLWKQDYTTVGGYLFGTQIGSQSDVYTGLRNLQDSRQLIHVIAGKRSYKDMLIEELRVTTDANTENALEVRARFKQVIIVDTVVRTLSAAATRSMSKGANAGKNAGQKALKNSPNGTPIGFAGSLENAQKGLPLGSTFLTGP